VHIGAGRHKQKIVGVGRAGRELVGYWEGQESYRSHALAGRSDEWALSHLSACFTLFISNQGRVQSIPLVAAVADEAGNIAVLAVAHNAVRRHAKVNKDAVMVSIDRLLEEVDCCDSCLP
jgi:hypothetical protein